MCSHTCQALITPEGLLGTECALATLYSPSSNDFTPEGLPECQAHNVQPRLPISHLSLFIMPEGLPGTKRAANICHIIMPEGLPGTKRAAIIVHVWTSSSYMDLKLMAR